MVKMTTSGFDISIHAPRAGSDAYCRKALRLVGGFQSTLPVRGATIRSRHITPRSRFQSTLPVRGATGNTGLPGTNAKNFNPRSPCGERPGLGSSFVRRFGFQSTLPVRGATSVPAGRECKPCDFNPRSPCGERLVQLADKLVLYTFQSTLPVRGATDKVTYNGKRYVFQSTLPVRGATASGRSPSRRLVISIHAPRAGSDAVAYVFTYVTHGISIHAPRAGSDNLPRFMQASGRISIHAPRAGSDGGAQLRFCSSCNFNPRSPCGERREIHGISQNV